MNVDKFPENPGPAAWADILPTEPNLPTLEETRIADWLIVGAGFAGLAAARRLQIKCPNDHIVVLEAQRLAEGPAGRNSGFMIDLPHDLASDDYGGKLEHDRITISQNREAIAFAQKTVHDLSLPDEAFRKIGKINAAASQKGLHHNRDYAKHLQKLGEKYENYDTQTMKDITGIDYYAGGLFTAGTVILQPALFIRSLGRKLISDRLNIYETSPVISMERIGKTWSAKTPNGVINAPKVILATNGHVESFGFFKRKLLHIFTYGSMTHALNSGQQKALGGSPEWGLTPADPMGTTVRRSSGPCGDRIIVRNSFTYEPAMRPSGKVLKRIYKTHKTSFGARFPMLKGLGMAYQWGGHLTLSLNNVAAFSEVEQDLFTACCQNGLGTVKGTLHGMAAADFAMGIESPLVKQLMQAPAPRKLPPEPIVWIGAKSRIGWGELLAGKEL